MPQRQVPAELSDIMDPSLLQAIHETFSEKNKVASGILLSEPNIIPVTFEFMHSRFCRAVRLTKEGLAKCRASDQEAMKKVKETFELNGSTKPYFYVCKHGLVDFCAPIVVDNRIIAYLLGGQFRCVAPEVRTPNQPILTDLPSDKGKMAGLRTSFGATRVFDLQDYCTLQAKVESLAEDINTIAKKLNGWHHVAILANFMKKASQMTDVNGLFELIIKELPQMVDAGHCSIFTVAEGRNTDENGNDEYLVLRKTSYERLAPEVNHACYRRGDGLTGWVWKHKRPLRLLDVNDKTEWASIADDLKWMHKYDDSDEHTSFLCVPIVGQRGDVIGVIRIPHKNVGVFTKHDEIFAAFLAKHVSWMMESKADEERYHLAQSLCRMAGKVFCRRRSQVFEGLAECMIGLFQSAGHAIFVNSYKSGSNHWTIEKTGGELILSGEWEGQHYSIHEGFTGKTIRTGETAIVQDLESAKDRGEYIPAVKDGESAMQAPLRCGDEVYGAIGIVSNRKFAFSRTTHLKLLEDLGSMGGYALKHANKWDAMTLLKPLSRFCAKLTAELVRKFTQT